MGVDLTIRCGNNTGASVYDAEKFYSYKNGVLVFTQKAPLLFIYLHL